MAFKEADVRDSLARNLHLLEADLVLVETELKLPNAVGARGYVDIFARDRYGNFVVIEVKRANQTARQALHEVLKYAELLQREHGHAPHRLRLMIASTTWHELTVPFSALARFCPYPLQGFEITVTSDGELEAAELVTGLAASVRGQISDDSIVLLCDNAEARDGVWSYLEPHLDEFGLDDAIGIALDYAGKNASLRTTYGLALIPTRMSVDRARAVGLIDPDHVAPGIGLDEIAEGYDEKDAPTLESEALNQLFTKLDRKWDDAEAFSPEKFVAEEQKGWTPVGVYRHGSFAFADYLTDEELIAAARGLEGLNRVVLRMTATPALRAPWDEMLLRVQLVLEGNDPWQTGTLAWLTEREGTEVDHHVAIYHPADLVRTLMGIVVHGDLRWLDELVVVCGDKATPDRVLGGVIAWNGEGVDLEQAVNAVVTEDEDDFVFQWSMGAPFFQAALMDALGLEYALVERIAGQEATWFTPNGNERRPDLRPDDLESFGRFVEARQLSIRAVVATIAARSSGVVG